MRSLDRAFKSRLNGTGLKPLVQYIKDLFSNNEQGVWYDPSDLSTLYQDAAGTIPVTAVEQPVGLILDKSKWSIQIDVTTLSAWAGPAIGGAVYNTQNVGLVKKVGTYYILSAEVSEYSGTGTVGFVGTDFGGSPVPSRSNNGLIFAIVLASSAIETRVFTRSTNTCKFTNISVRELPGNHASQITATSRPVLSARVNLLTETEFRNGVTDAHVRGGLVSASSISGYLGALAFGYDGTTSTYAYKKDSALQNVTQIIRVIVRMDDGLPPAFGPTAATTDFTLVIGGSSWGVSVTSYQVKDLGTGLFAVSAVIPVGSVSVNNSGVLKVAQNSSRTFKVTAFDLRPANTGTSLPDYQRVNTSTDYDTAGFPHYLKFELDDWLVTPSINFTSTDKMMVCAGVRKLSNTSDGILVELGNASPGAFWLGAPGNAATEDIFNFSDVGGSRNVRLSTAAPITGVYSSRADFGAKTIDGRINTNPMVAAGSFGSGGTYGNYPLYIGRRGGTSLSFNGHLYGLIIRGAATSDSQIKSVERYVNTKTRAYTT